MLQGHWALLLHLASRYKFCSESRLNFELIFSDFSSLVIKTVPMFQPNNYLTIPTTQKHRHLLAMYSQDGQQDHDEYERNPLL